MIFVLVMVVRKLKDKTMPLKMYNMVGYFSAHVHSQTSFIKTVIPESSIFSNNSLALSQDFASNL